MNLLLLRPDELQPDGTYRCAGRRARHAHAVLGARLGDTLVVGLVGGGIGQGVVLASKPEELLLRASFETRPPAPPGIDLVLAMPRPRVLRRLVETMAALGVKRIVLLRSARVEKSYFDSPLATPAAIEESLLLGLEQARDTVLPEVIQRRRFKPFVEDEADRLWPPDVPRLLADPAAAAAIEDCVVGTEGNAAVVAVGPEGGFVPDEVLSLERRSFQRFHLGPRALRVDAAVVASIASVELLRRLGRK